MRWKTWFVAFGIVIGVLGIAGSASAQDSGGDDGGDDVTEEETNDVADFFTWYTEDGGPDWAQGGLFAGLGAVGALVIAYGAIGGALPGTAGKVSIDQETARLEKMSARLQALVEADPVDAPGIKSVADAVNEMRDDLQKDRQKQFGIAALVYLLLGAFFASALAGDLVQAIIFGASWTSLLGTFGLKTDLNKRIEKKDEALTAVVTTMQTQATLAPGEEPESVSDATSTADVALAL